MAWYEKLREYFPIEEMKSKEHMTALLKENNHYRKEEGPHHVLMYVETESYVFVDYLFVSEAARGEGVGKKLLADLKAKGKPIFLEVEPVDERDKDTEKRLKFYAREQFRHACRIDYNRRSLATGEQTILEILYWSPDKADEKMIYHAMRQIYEQIHTYKDRHFYGDQYDPADQVLTYCIERKQNILQPYTTAVSV